MIRAMKSPRTAIVHVLCVACWAGHGVAATPATLPATTTPATDAQLRAAILALGASAAEDREAAEERLLAIGHRARAALAEAASSDDPEMARRAASLLPRLPVYDDADPPQVRELLRPGWDADDRWLDAMQALEQLPAGAAAPALLRVTRHAAKPDRRWMAAQVVRRIAGRSGGPVLPEVLRAMAGEPENAAALWLAGTAWERADDDRADALYTRVVELATRGQSGGRGHDGAAFESLRELRRRRQQWNGVADVLRRWHAYEPDRVNLIDDLFSLHAQHGPLPGYATDVGRHALLLLRPQVLYATARLVGDRGGRTWVADCVRQAAFVVPTVGVAAGDGADGVQRRREAVANFLKDQEWYDEAMRELEAILAIDDAKDNRYAINVHFTLASIAAARGDNARSAAAYREALGRYEPGQGSLMATIGDGIEVYDEEAIHLMTSIMHRQAFRAARAAGDAEGAVREAEAMLAMAGISDWGGLYGEDADVSIDAVMALRNAGRAASASALFAQAYGLFKRQVDHSNGHPSRLNALAWLCARCNERLPEARELADRAVAAEPNNAESIDTAAECRFRLGQVEEAIRLETRALELRPGHPFLTKQLQRFKEGRASK